MLTALLALSMFLQAQVNQWHIGDIRSTSLQLLAADDTGQYVLIIAPPPLPEAEKCLQPAVSNQLFLCEHSDFNWKAIYDLKTEWTFRDDGKDYVISGADLLRLIKEHAKQ